MFHVKHGCADAYYTTSMFHVEHDSGDRKSDTRMFHVKHENRKENRGKQNGMGFTWNHGAKMSKDELKMTHSGILHDKSGRGYVLVRFERASKDGGKKKVVIGEGGDPIVQEEKKMDEIEIKIPGDEVILNRGFEKKEEEELILYLKEHGKEIRKSAEAISSFKHLFG